MEIWKDVKGYVELYQVSNMGRVMSFHHDKVHGKILKPWCNADGYLMVTLCRDGKHKAAKVHRLAAELFLGPAPSPKHQVNHKNGDRADNRVENLEWVTCSENHRHAYRMLGRKAAPSRGEAHGSAILTDWQVVEIRKLYAMGDHSYRELGKMFGVAKPTIGQIVRRETWKHVS